MHLRLSILSHNYKDLSYKEKSILGQGLRYFCNLIKRPISATFGRPLHHFDRHELLVSRSGTAKPQQHAYASGGLLMWNDLPATTRAQTLNLVALPLLLALLRLFFFGEGLCIGASLIRLYVRD